MEQTIDKITFRGSFKQNDKRLIELAAKIREVSDLPWTVLFRTLDMHEFEARNDFIVDRARIVLKAGYTDELVRKIKSVHCLHNNPSVTADVKYAVDRWGGKKVSHFEVVGVCPDCCLRLAHDHYPGEAGDIDEWISAMRERIARVASFYQEVVRMAVRNTKNTR